MTYSELGELAKATVIKVMQEGEKKYPANDFMERDIDGHFSHLVDHVSNLIYESKYNKDELTHIMTRAAIMLAKLEQNQGNPQT